MGNNKFLDKGNRLEDAVKYIFTTIIKNNPSLKQAQFFIEPKKIINPGGSRKEIDLYIKVDPGNDLESIFIFECKNYKSTVSNDAIVSFSKKIEETNATKGFFIATKYSINAIKEAEKDSRMVLLLAKEERIDLESFPEIHMYYHEKETRNIKVNVIMTSASNREKAGLKVRGERLKIDKNTQIILNNNIINTKLFFKSLEEQVVDEKMKYESTHLLEEGEYNYSHQKKFVFMEKDLLVDGEEVERINLEVDFKVRIIKPKIVSSFDIEKKGIYIKQEFNTPDGNILKMVFIKLKEV